MEETYTRSTSSGYFNPAYEKCKSIARAIRGYPTQNIFTVNMNCLRTLYTHKWKIRAEAVIHARGVEQPAHQLRSGLEADAEASSKIKSC